MAKETEHVDIRIRLPRRGLVEALDSAARQLAVSRAGYMRLATMAALRADGVDLKHLAEVA